MASGMVAECVCHVSYLSYSEEQCTILTFNQNNSIGDWYPERNLFQILIALTSGKQICVGIATVVSNILPQDLALH